jgi:tetratricopeptide (TPR) repeat protein
MTSDSAISIEKYFKSGYALVVEDEKTLRKAISDMLRMIGIEHVAVAEDGDIALAALKDKKHPRLERIPEKARNCCLFAFLDWYMPRMSGIDVAMEMKADKELENIPILMITAESRADRIIQAVAEVGVNGYLVKPFRPRDLEEKILAVIAQNAEPPGHVRLISAGEKMMKEGKVDEAIFLLNRALEIKDVSARINVLLGEAYLEKGEVEEAERSFGQAMIDNPRYLKSYVALADLFLKDGKKERALSPLKKAAEISPRNAGRQATLGKIYLDLGEKKEAQKFFEEALKLDPKKSKEAAEAYLENGDAEQAEIYFRRSLPREGEKLTDEEKKDYVHTANRLGIALKRQGKLLESIEEYQKAQRLSPEDEAIYYNLGKAYSALAKGEKTRQHLEEAEKCFRQAVELAPDFAEAKEELKKLENQD